MCIPAEPNVIATSVCQLCSRVNRRPGCLHQRAVCRQRQNHPGNREISYFVNAEYDIFNGCGFCKFAAKFPTCNGKNPGWPGCCRPPTEAEADLIPDSCWAAVATFWRVPIPEKVRRRISPRSQAAPLRKDPPSREPTPQVARPAQPAKEGPRGSKFVSFEAPKRLETHASNGFSASKITISQPSRSRSSSLSVKIAAADRTSEDVSRYNYISPTPDSKSRFKELPKLPRPISSLERSLSDLKISRPALEPSSNASSKRHSIASISDVTDFTDYLSDESDIRLQRDAEERVFEKHRSLAEQVEFMQARKALEPMGTEPPPTWMSGLPRRPARR